MLRVRDRMNGTKSVNKISSQGVLQVMKLAQISGTVKIRSFALSKGRNIQSARLQTSNSSLAMAEKTIFWTIICLLTSMDILCDSPIRKR